MTRTVTITTSGKQIPYHGRTTTAHITFEGDIGWNPPESNVRDVFRALVSKASDQKSWYEEHIVSAVKIIEFVDVRRTEWEVISFDPYVD